MDPRQDRASPRGLGGDTRRGRAAEAPRWGGRPIWPPPAGREVTQESASVERGGPKLVSLSVGCGADTRAIRRVIEEIAEWHADAVGILAVTRDETALAVRE